MKTMTKASAIFTAIVLLTTFYTQNNFAQVTIGAGLRPISGALLDLKQYNATETDNATANKGLILPRVKLTDKANLFPMFQSGDAEYTGDKKVTEDSRHMGLLVFNVNNSQTSGIGVDFVPGMYVWSGEKWMALGASPATPDTPTRPNTNNTVKGISGKIYKTRRFGAAGEWMIENLAETKYDTKALDGNRVITEKVNPTSEKNRRYYAYPNNSESLRSEHPEYGLLYSLVAANNGQVSERFETMEYPRTSQVQGICPNGWLLPSNTDWNKLQTELEAKPELYSTNKKGKDIGITMRSEKVVKDSKVLTYGKSLENGLNVYLVGHVVNGQNIWYGYAAGFWTSSVFNDNYAPIRSIIYNINQHVDGGYKTSSEMYSVRCMKAS